MDIYRPDPDATAGGPYGAVIPDADEYTIGAFTAANLNDTDGDGTVDRDDSDVSSGTNGRDECDLMRIILERPDPDLGGMLKLEVLSGDVKIWETFKKGAPITTLEFPMSDFTADHDGDGNDDVEWWVEARSATALQGIELAYSYKPAGADDYLCPDKVRGTAVWATVTKVLTVSKTPSEVDVEMGSDWCTYADAGAIYGPQDACWAEGGTGPNIGPNPCRRNGIVVEFSITPADIETVPLPYRPVFDTTRQNHGASFRWAEAISGPFFFWGGGMMPTHFPDMNEEANDDPSVSGETLQPSPLGHIWQYDNPGSSVGDLWAHRNNFRDFLRVRFDGTRPAGSCWDGTRCSPKQPWYSRTTGGLAISPNDIGVGSITFAHEALHTKPTVNPTVDGLPYDAVVRGLAVADNDGATSESVDLRLIDDDLISDDLLHEVTAVEKESAATKTGDQTAYEISATYAAKPSAEIYGPDGDSGEYQVEMAHEISIPGVNPQSPSVSVQGTAW